MVLLLIGALAYVQRWDFSSLGLGTAAGASILFAALLGARRRRLRWRVGTLANWSSARLWLGGLSLPFALLHADFTARSPLTTALLIVLTLSIVSGCVGRVVQHVVPQIMTARLASESPHNDLAPVLARIEREIATVVQGASMSAPADCRHAMERFQREVVEPFFDGSGVSALSSEHGATIAFAALRGAVTEPLHESVDRISLLCAKGRTRMEEARFRRLTFGWRLLHVPLSFTVVLLLAAHVVSALYY